MGNTAKLSRAAIEQASKEVIVREAETLLITILGSRDQNQMKFNKDRVASGQPGRLRTQGLRKQTRAFSVTDPEWIVLRRNV